MLTAKQILDRNLIKLSKEKSEAYDIKLVPAQMGIDLHLVYVAKVHQAFSVGFIPADGKGKAKLPVCSQIEPNETLIDGKPTKTWKLEPGDYEIGFAESLEVPLDCAAIVLQRSSVRRCGTTINSPLYDPGFHTDMIGTFMHVNVPVEFEVASRVAQIVFFTSDEEAEPYNGQYQGCGVLQGNH